MFVAAGAERCNLCGFDTGSATRQWRKYYDILEYNDILKGNRLVAISCVLSVQR